MPLRKKPKKRLVFPVILLFFLGLIFFFGWKKFSSKLELPNNQGIINPLPSPTQKENFESMLKKEGLVPLSLNFGAKEIQASFSGSLTALFSSEKELTSQVISLQFILSRSKIEGKLPKLVDLRFDKPVILY